MHSRVVASGVFFNHSTNRPFRSAVVIVVGTAACAFLFFCLGAAAVPVAPGDGEPLGNSSAFRFSFWPLAA